jgi:bifunctional ADP-heptose synthase (sugar kinase/adenylyltransferase)
VARDVLRRAGAILVSDYGMGLAADGHVRAAIAAARAGTPIVWDPHPRGASPLAGVRAVTPSEAEAKVLAAAPGDGLAATTAHALRLLDRWRCGGVAVTLGGRGALLVSPGAHPLAVPPPREPDDGADTCGGGDRFAGEMAALLAGGALLSEAIVGAVETASAFVAAGGVGTPGQRPGPPPGRDMPAGSWLPWSGRAAARSWPRAGASTCCTPATCNSSAARGHSATAWSCA